jgi:hypothetical protein
MADNQFKAIAQTYDGIGLKDSRILIGACDTTNLTNKPITQSSVNEFPPAPNSLDRILRLNFAVREELLIENMQIYVSY